MRSKYGTFPEYHTSDDDLNLVTPPGLAGALALYMECVKILEYNHVYINKEMCEPNLGRRGLYPLTSTLEDKTLPRSLIDFMIYCDGNRNILDIAEILGKSIDEIIWIVEQLRTQDLIKEVN
jgi:aminopeptidase-like protein